MIADKNILFLNFQIGSIRTNESNSHKKIKITNLIRSIKNFGNHKHLISMKQNYLLYLLTLAILSGCALFKGHKEIEGIKFSYADNSTINYGHNFYLKTILVYKGGKEKNITSKKELNIELTGGKYNNGKITIDGYPEQLGYDTIFVKAIYTVNDTSYSLQQAIPFNYKGDLKIDFVGNQGSVGEDGKNRSTPLLLRNGKDGEAGENGENGQNGHELTVNVWKEIETDRYRIKVSNLITSKVYYYTYKDNGFGIVFNVNGGNGGNGGNAGDGGTGKDGIITEKKNKNPGNGGDGGNGGTGGNGGNGGTVYVFLHPSAKELKNKIAIYNFGGESGKGGSSGDGGKPGTPEDGQSSGTDGVSGTEGGIGKNGYQGTAFQVVIEDFDIEN